MTHHDPTAVFMPLDDLARALGISRRTLYRRIDSGDVEAVTIGGQRMARAVIRDDGDVSERADDGTAPDGTRGTDAPGIGTVARGTPSQTGTERHDLSALVAWIDTLARERHELSQHLVDAAAARAEALTLADVAVRDRDAARREALEARELADLHRARAERAAVLAGELARLPWWRFAERRRIADELVQLRLVG